MCLQTIQTLLSKFNRPGFGRAVQVLGDRVFVGEPGFHYGMVWMFRLIDQTLVVEHKVTRPLKYASRGFGHVIQLVETMDKQTLLFISDLFYNNFKGGVFCCHIDNPEELHQVYEHDHNDESVGHTMHITTGETMVRCILTGFNRRTQEPVTITLTCPRANLGMSTSFKHVAE